ncbi:protein of unknown function [Xenorhabdus doucetiae]|uniref:Uncharacterized protein n=1 Tax=Xenorhabdus doucetiae TaxID=351671 RepID=A0A068QYP3_9GAMM|nr:protein of unknown function [Xenorhabdus doucetiae]
MQLFKLIIRGDLFYLPGEQWGFNKLYRITHWQTSLITEYNVL